MSAVMLNTAAVVAVARTTSVVLVVLLDGAAAAAARAGAETPYRVHMLVEPVVLLILVLLAPVVLVALLRALPEPLAQLASERPTAGLAVVAVVLAQLLPAVLVEPVALRAAAVVVAVAGSV